MFTLRELRGISMLAATATLAAGAHAQLKPKQVIIRPAVLGATAKITPFNPAVNGFKFVNSFSNDFVPQLDWRTGGLCGGMSYSALDYYFNKMRIPQQVFKPAVGTTLQRYLYDRQTNSIVDNVDKWAEVGFNPGGARNSEFFNWGLQLTGRIQELKNKIDAGIPCVLGLQGAGKEGSHQVIAYGYDMGRYKGDLGPHKEDFKIFVCDPNHPGEKRTLVPLVGQQIYSYAEAKPGEETWQTYFVDGKYHANRPPLIPNANYPNDGKAYELVLDFKTGGDDLRGGNDNVNVTLTTMNGQQQVFNNVNLGKRWIVNDWEAAELILKTPVDPKQIKTLLIADTFGGGIGGDNWDMAQLNIYVLGGNMWGLQKSVGFKRFTGDDKTLLIKVNDAPTASGQANKLNLKFVTGSDDLRGGNDNLNVIVKYRNGHIKSFPRVNGGGRWADNTPTEVNLDLDEAALPNDIVSVTLQTTFGGGMGGDNWNMNSVIVTALGPGVNSQIFTHGFKRFTGDDKTLVMSHP